MSGVGVNDEVLRPILLRTSTPAPSEKVLLYLENLSRDGPMSPMSPPSNPPSDLGEDFGQPLPLKSPTAMRSPILSAKGSRLGTRGIEEQLNPWGSTNGNGAPHKDADLDSNIQEESTSNAGHHEPGPDDEPRPFYESYGSSWGNFGPLPGTAHNAHPPWQNATAKAAGVPLPPSVLMSPRSAGMNIRVDSPSTQQPSRARASSRASRRSRSAAPEEVDRATVTGGEEFPPQMSKAVSMGGSRLGNGERPMSSKSVVSQRSKGLPQDVYDGREVGDNRSTMSKQTARKSQITARGFSKAPSLSPSDSPSNVGKKRAPPVQQSVRSQSNINGGEGLERPRDASPVRSTAARSQVPLSPNPNRPFSPHRHAPTNEDLFQAALRSRESRAPHPASQVNGGRRSQVNGEGEATPTPSRPASPEPMTVAEEKVVREYLSKTPRTSYAPSALEPEIQNTHYHDMELCILLHALDDPSQHEVAKKALRKAVRQRVKRLGMKYDNESIKQLRKSFHDHDPAVHMQPSYTGATTVLPQDPPDWARQLMEGMSMLQNRVEHLGPKIDSLKSSQNGSFTHEADPHGYTPSERERYGQSPMTQTVQIHATGTMAESVFQPPDTEGLAESAAQDHGREEDEFEDDETRHRGTTHDGETQMQGMSEYMDGREDSPGQQYLEEELYKLRVRPGGSQSAYTHKTWELARDDGGDDGDYEDYQPGALTESGLPEIPGSQPGYTEAERQSPPLPPVPPESTAQDMAHAQGMYPQEFVEELPPPWQRIHQRLLSWAIVWPMTELDTALNSTTRGNQVDEVALSIWSTQTYKRYVRSKMTDSPGGRVDRLFVPPNMADAISNAVYNGRHGDACAMLRDLWSPFGLEGMPRLLIVLAKHRSDENHWVVHRFSLPEGTLTTYDTYPERCLPDGRPLGWWFAIRIAWPNAIYPSPDHLMQKMVRLHRPMQLGIDNSVAAAGIWRNILMGSRAERSLDLERLRDLINTEVKNLRQRKQMGKLSIGSQNTRPTWFD